MQNSLSEQIQDVFQLHKSNKLAMKNSTYSYRIEKLQRLKKLVLEKKDEIALALNQDFHKPKVEAELTEVMPIISLINLLEKDLLSWMADEKVKTPLLFKGAKSWIRREGKGNCLIISPWNYPFQLALYPLITSFAAGNTSVLKPSEFTPATNKIITLLLEDIFTRAEVAVVEGDAHVSEQLLALPFDHIFFTGSTQVGKIVMAAASKHLASVALELGGKSPIVIDRGIKFSEAAKKVVWGKLVNGGQTCVAPDYMLIHQDDKALMVQEMVQSLEAFYSTNWEENKDYNYIITERHADRLRMLVSDALTKGAVLEYGGEISSNSRLVRPTILSNVSMDMKIMQEEIFGPLLPIVSVTNHQQMIDCINSHDNALAMYVFSNSSEVVEQFLAQTNNGGVTINDLLINVAHPLLPFGGAGKSGIGKYHGRFGFDEFSNLRAIMRRDFDLGASYFYPPYTEKKESLVSSLLKKFSGLF
jgi:aldehyde dehydrogenase (NAD+)